MMTSTFEVETCDPYVRHKTHQGRQSLASLFDYTPNVYLLACWTLTIKYFETRSNQEAHTLANTWNIYFTPFQPTTLKENNDNTSNTYLQIQDSAII